MDLRIKEISFPGISSLEIVLIKNHFENGSLSVTFDVFNQKWVVQTIEKQRSCITLSVMDCKI